MEKILKLDHHQKLTNLSKLKHNDNNLLSVLNIWPETAFWEYIQEIKVYYKTYLKNY